MAHLYHLMRSHKMLTFLALFGALFLGVIIGSILSDRAFTAGPPFGATPLVLTSDDAPGLSEPEATLQVGFKRVAASVAPAVVHIMTESLISRRASDSVPQRLRRFFGDDFWKKFAEPDARSETEKRNANGSGIIVDSAGFILTNHHVVAPLQLNNGARRVADRILIKLSTGEELPARVLGMDPESDLAVIKVDDGSALPYARIGDSAGLDVGDWVLAVGSPFGFDKTVTAGIISATERMVPFSDIFGGYIQTDAAINPGNSGGPLVNMRGEVVGVNSFISTNTGSFSGVGFAVPSRVFVNSYNQIIESGRVRRGWLGIELNIRPLSSEMAEHFGVAGQDPDGIRDGDGALITGLIDEAGASADYGPAAVAGLREGDVVVSFKNREIEDLFDLRNEVATTPPGKTVPLVAIRDGEILEFQVTLAERRLGNRAAEGPFLGNGIEGDEGPQEIGLEFRTLGKADARELGLNEQIRGVVILSVKPGTLADSAGLVKRQVITHVNGVPVETGDDFRKSVDQIRSGEIVVLQIVSPSIGRAQTGFTGFTKP